jgi:SAM-dependent methyltransferase
MAKKKRQARAAAVQAAGPASSTPKTPEQIARDYLRRLWPQSPFRDNQRFWTWLEKKHGPTARTIYDLSRAIAEGEEMDIYSVKNQRLDLSLDVTFGFLGDFSEKYLVWLLGEYAQEQIPEPARVLDIGCDNGVLTCFYAWFFGHSRIVGVDRCEQGIERAKELATKLQLDNVQFIQADLADLSALGAEQFDLISASRVYHTVRRRAEIPHWRYSELWEAYKDQEPTASLTAPLALLEPAGKFVSVEPVGSIDQAISWCSMLHRAGLTIDWNESFLLSFQEIGDKTLVPAFLASRLAEPTELKLDDIIAFLAYKDLVNGSEETPFIGPSAEVLYEAVNPKKLIFGTQITFHDQSGVQRFDVWEAGPLLLAYNTSIRGYRELRLYSTNVRTGVINRVRRFGQEREDVGDVIYYDSEVGRAL